MPKIKISPLSVIYIFVLIKAKTPHLPALALAIVLHELGHLFCAKLLKIKIKGLNLSILGARIEARGDISYTDEFLLASSGPFVNLLSFAIACPFSNTNSQLLPFATVSLCLAIFNLLPLSTLDGGRILKCLAFRIFTFGIALKIQSVVSFFTLFFLWLISVYTMLKISAGLSMLVFCSFFFAKCFILDNKK